MTVEAAEALDRTIVLMQDYVAASEQDVADLLTRFRVRLSADEQTLAQAAGRTALFATFECAARLGVRLMLDVPPTTVPLPPGYRGANALDALLDRSRSLITPAETAGGADRETHLHIDLGRTAIAPNVISLGGSNTEARVRIGSSAGGWTGELPFGAGLAAAAGAAEITRAAIAGLLGGEEPRTSVGLEHRPVDLALPPLTSPRNLDLGSVDFVSAGAITNAVLFLLYQIAGIRMDGRVLDDDVAKPDNLNRYLLLTTEHLGLPKVQYLEELLPSHLRGVRLRVENEASLGGEAPLAAVVCTGVDWVEGRWAVQQLAPHWHGVGATSHTYASVSEHWPGQTCAACIHPEAGDHLERMPTISFVSLLAGTHLAYRLVRQAIAATGQSDRTQVLDALNLSSADAVIEDHPALNPKCRLSKRHSG